MNPIVIALAYAPLLELVLVTLAGLFIAGVIVGLASVIMEGSR